MDLCRKIPLSGGLPSEYQPEQVCSKLGSLDDLFSGHTTEGDVNLEWLSIFVEDCLSITGNCLTPQIIPPNPHKTTTSPATATTNPKPQNPKPQIHKFLIPSKARTIRKRNPLTKGKNPLTSWSHHVNPHGQTLQLTSSDPPLLQQAYCVCHQVSFGDMIACDNESCQGGEWFHYSCVGLTPETRFKGKWYCPTCRQLPQ